MFDQILQLVKDHLGSNQETAGAIPPEQADAIHNEIATQVTEGLKTQAAQQGGVAGLLSSLTSNLASGGLATSAITGGLVGGLAKKFGLNPVVTGAIAAAIPGLVQKFVNKVNDPNDPSITPEHVANAVASTVPAAPAS